jgi:hypothetical protein
VLDACRRLRCAGVALALSFSAWNVRAAEVAAVFAPACVPWSAAHYRAEKLFASMDLDVSARLLEDAPADYLWPVAGRAALTPSERPLLLNVATRGPGRRSLAGEMLLDARSGGILQYVSLRGPEPRHRVYRFTASGPERRTAQPRRGEEGRPPKEWSDVDVRERYYAGGPIDAPVLEVSTLLYLLPASGLQEPGDRLDVLGYATSADEVYEVTATAGGSRTVDVDYRERTEDANAARREPVAILPITVKGAPRAGAGGEGSFEILGLRDVEFLLDPVRRVVVALEAQVPAAGHVAFRLQTLQRSAVASQCEGAVAR